MHRGLSESQRADLARLSLPLPSARVDLAPDDPRKGLLDDILNEEGLEARHFKLKGFREMFFSRGERAALCLPADLHQEAADDDLNPGRQKLLLACELPRGCYMTLLVKRVTAAR